VGGLFVAVPFPPAPFFASAFLSFAAAALLLLA
jgi:hypothetical protein